jgi:hypothetical protein
MGVDPVVFERHIRASNPELADKIVRDVFVNKDMSSLIRAGKQFATHRQSEIVNKIEGAGVSTFEDHGTVFLNIAELERAAGISIPRRQGRGDFAGRNSGSISLTEALRLG